MKASRLCALRFALGLGQPHSHFVVKKSAAMCSVLCANVARTVELQWTTIQQRQRPERIGLVFSWWEAQIPDSSFFNLAAVLEAQRPEFYECMEIVGRGPTM
eukprot:scaffold147702_cov33-Tisochrysis_lutea.AAC.1